jgi:predicted RNase H-like HicB family nuclease
MRYAVVYEKTETGYCAYVPDLPGCITTGRSLEETEANMREAITGHLAAMEADGDPIPEPTTVAGNIDLTELKKAS